jgi:predicted TPR repeat methyltransferase
MFFDEAALTWDNLRRCERAQVLAAAIKETWVGTQNGVLDFGCGTGLLSFALSPYTTAMYGYDPSPEMQRIFHTKLETYQTKNVQLLTEDKMKELTFNVIFSSMVFHHILDIKAEILKLKNLLAQNGSFILIDLDKDDGAFHKNEPDFNGHNGFDRNEMCNVLKSCGFKDISLITIYKGVRPIGDTPVEYSLFMAIAR